MWPSRRYLDSLVIETDVMVGELHEDDEEDREFQG